MIRRRLAATGAIGLVLVLVAWGLARYVTGGDSPLETIIVVAAVVLLAVLVGATIVLEARRNDPPSPPPLRSPDD